MKPNSITVAIMSRYLMPIRWFAAAVGVVIAITCSIILSRDAQLPANGKAQSQVIGKLAIEQFTSSPRISEISILRKIK
jgi:hypothetical protein